MEDDDDEIRGRVLRQLRELDGASPSVIFNY